LIDCASGFSDASLKGLRRLSGVGTSRSIATVSTCVGVADFGFAFVLGMSVISFE